MDANPFPGHKGKAVANSSAWSPFKAVTWKDFLRESVVDPSKALAAKAVNARVVYEPLSTNRLNHILVNQTNISLCLTNSQNR